MDLELWRGFRRDMVRRNLSEATIDGRRARLRLFSDWLGDTPILEATADDIEAWLDARGVKARTRSVYVSSLHAFYEWARRTGKLSVPPTMDVIRPRVPRLLPHPISPADFQVALEHANQRMRCWLVLGAFQGFRCVEISGLRCEDVQTSVDPPTIRIDRGKGGHADVMPLNQHTERELLLFGVRRRGAVFERGDGKPVHPNTVSCLGNRYLHSLGIDATMHSLRHAFLTWVYAETQDLRLTQEMGRHADPRTTAGYAAFSDERAVQVVRNLRPPARNARAEQLTLG